VAVTRSNFGNWFGRRPSTRQRAGCIVPLMKLAALWALSALALALAIYVFAKVWLAGGPQDFGAENLIFTGVCALVIALIAPVVTLLDWWHTRM
jgi:hypothetical protein